MEDTSYRSKYFDIIIKYSDDFRVINCYAQHIETGKIIKFPCGGIYNCYSDMIGDISNILDNLEVNKYE